MWELGGTILQINCLTNTERLLEQLRETSASHLVCDSFNIEQGLNLRQQLEGLKQIIQVGESEGHEDVVTVKSLMDAEANTRIGGGKFDWDMAPICLMFTTRNGESKIVKHTNKSLTAQVFSPKGASNNWFDQVFVRFFLQTWYLNFMPEHRRLFVLCRLVFPFPRLGVLVPVRPPGTLHVLHV